MRHITNNWVEGKIKGENVIEEKNEKMKIEK